MSEILRQRRSALGMSQADLAERVGVDKRQIRRYEAGETQPTLLVARALARALEMTIDELAGEDVHRIDLSGDWWACWQTWNQGREILNPHKVRMRQKGDFVDVIAVTRGSQKFEDGGYLWRGEMRLWDNEILMGWYVADESTVRSKGTLYFVIHQHGQRMSGRWVGLSYDGPVITGWGSIAKTEEEALDIVNSLKDEGKETT